MIVDTSIYTEFDSGVYLDCKNIQNIYNFQKVHENGDQKVDSISEKVPEYDFEGPGPQNPQKIANNL